MPIYEISTDGEEAKRLVKAASASAAIAHCAKGKFSSRLMNKVEDAAPLFAAGVTLEDATAETGERRTESEASETRVSKSEAEPSADGE